MNSREMIRRLEPYRDMRSTIGTISIGNIIDCISQQERLLQDKIRYINELQIKIEQLEEKNDVSHFVKEIQDEISDAIANNRKVIAEREEKHNIDPYKDDFCIRVDGKIDALSGISYFIDELTEEKYAEKNKKKEITERGE